MISLLCPTRKRPHNIKRLYQSILDAADRPDEVELVIYIDDDDHSYDDMDLPNLVKVIGPRIVLSSMWNHCFEESNGDILMHCGDDIVFRSSGWDTKIKEVFDNYPDKIVLVYGDDGYKHEKLATHSFLHRKWVNAVGYFCPPYFSCDYNDNWLTELAEKIGRKVYLPDVYTEHMHPVAKKAVWDKTHRERLERGRRDDVANLYRKLETERIKDAKKLESAIR